MSDDQGFDFPAGYYRDRYGPLSGHDWLRKLPDYERAAFSHLGFAQSGYGVTGGIARAATAARDDRGRFLSAGVVLNEEQDQG